MRPRHPFRTTVHSGYRWRRKKLEGIVRIVLTKEERPTGQYAQSFSATLQKRELPHMRRTLLDEIKQQQPLSSHE